MLNSVRFITDFTCVLLKTPVFEDPLGFSTCAFIDRTGIQCSITKSNAYKTVIVYACMLRNFIYLPTNEIRFV